MLLVTARDDAVPLPAAAGVRSLPLAGLNRDATATVVQQIVGPEASQDYIAEVTGAPAAIRSSPPRSHDCR